MNKWISDKTIVAPIATPAKELTDSDESIEGHILSKQKLYKI